MKKTLRTLMMGMMALLAGNALTSCSSDDEPQVAQQEGKTGYVEFTLTRGADTRTDYSFNEETKGLDVTWNKDDKVVVLYDNNSIIEEFELKDGEGTKTATFVNKNSQLVDKSGYVVVQYAPGYVSGTAPKDYILDLSKQEGTLEKLGNYDILTFEATLDNGKIGDAKFVAIMAILHFPKDLDLGVSATSADLVLGGGYNAMGGESPKGDITIKNVDLNGGKLSNDVYVSVAAYTSGLSPTTLKVADKTYLLPEIPDPGKIYTFAESNLKEVDAEPLTLEPISGDVTVTIRNELGLVISYVLDGGEKVSNTEGDRNNITFTVPAGSKVQLFGDNEAYATREYSYWTNIQCSADCYIYGNIMSLIDSENYITKTELTGVETFARLFDNNTRIKNHPNKALTLPATTLTNNCYARMFYGCTGLTTAPKLPATDLAIGCYKSMFYGCSFTTAPELLALNLADACYQAMFSHCTSLTTAPELPATTLTNSCYFEMFRACTSLTTAPELPAKIMVQGCYNSMFQGCVTLTKAPDLPATDLAVACYGLMFYGCSSLTTAPELPATTLEERCYRSMFENCINLTTAPKLPATILKESCYEEMFYGCTSLKAVTCLAINISASRCTYRWMRNVASGGTFTRAATMDEGQSWGDGVSGIPSGWSVVNYGG
ncbi:MAG: hypothetical protein E7100_03730 [Bacteroidaceae bacterium]|jgi:hypothetical protein|nr:hypothetical protein [Bacteroidaceae bacterium]